MTFSAFPATVSRAKCLSGTDELEGKEDGGPYLIFMRLGARISPMDEDGDGETVEAAAGSGEGAREGRFKENIIFVPGREETGRDEPGNRFCWLETPPPLGGRRAGQEGQPGGGGVCFQMASLAENIVNSCYLSHLFLFFWGSEQPQTERKKRRNGRAVALARWSFVWVEWGPNGEDCRFWNPHFRFLVGIRRRGISGDLLCVSNEEGSRRGCVREVMTAWSRMAMNPVVHNM